MLVPPAVVAVTFTMSDPAGLVAMQIVLLRPMLVGAGLPKPTVAAVAAAYVFGYLITHSALKGEVRPPAPSMRQLAVPHPIQAGSDYAGAHSGPFVVRLTHDAEGGLSSVRIIEPRLRASQPMGTQSGRTDR